MLAAIIESIQLDSARRGELIERLQLLQKRLKYGTATATSIALHELGFMDRILAREIANILGVDTQIRPILRRALRRHEEAVESCLEQYPAYYNFVWRRVLWRGQRRL